jgi:hypothetical protein
MTLVPIRTLVPIPRIEARDNENVLGVMMKSLTNASAITTMAHGLNPFGATSTIALGIANDDIETMISSAVRSVRGITPTIDDLLAILFFLEITGRILNSTVRLVAVVVVLATILGVVASLLSVSTRHD